MEITRNAINQLYIELKLKWVKYCVLPAAGTDNDNTNHNNVIFTIKKKNYMFLLSLYQQWTTKNYQNFLAKDLKKQFI